MNYCGHWNVSLLPEGFCCRDCGELLKPELQEMEKQHLEELRKKYARK